MVMFEVIFRTTPPRRFMLFNYAFAPEKHNPPNDTPEGLWALLCDCVSNIPFSVDSSLFHPNLTSLFIPIVLYPLLSPVYTSSQHLFLTIGSTGTISSAHFSRDSGSFGPDREGTYRTYSEVGTHSRVIKIPFLQPHTPKACCARTCSLTRAITGIATCSYACSCPYARKDII